MAAVAGSLAWRRAGLGATWLHASPMSTWVVSAPMRLRTGAAVRVGTSLKLLCRGFVAAAGSADHAKTVDPPQSRGTVVGDGAALLKVYVKRAVGGVDFAAVEVDAGADVAALKEAVAAKLQLGVPPDAVTLTVDGADVALDSRKSLVDAGIAHGASIVVAIPPAFLDLPPPLDFARETVGGTEVMVATLPQGGGAEAPIFLTLEQHSGLLRFIDGSPSRIPQMLMVTGTIKTGKTVIVHEILPRLLASRSDSPRPCQVRVRPRPVIFSYAFPLGRGPDDAAHHLMRAFAVFARSIHAPFDVPATASDSLDGFPAAVAEFAERIRKGGGELWLLLDELQAPIIASATPADAAAFTQQLKMVRNVA